MKTDEQIVEAVKSGRREGQDLMVGRYGQEVFAMIARQVPSVMDAEELTQDTFLKAFAAIDRYEFTVSIEDTEVWQTDITDEQLEAELSTGNEERIQRLELLIDDLPSNERLLLTLHYFENRTLDECSYIMDATPRALANRLYRIRKKLYKQLKQL